jgi:EmrB/QacA subfamily drug resistance transporter
VSTTAQTPVPAPPETPSTRDRRWLGLSAVLAAMIMNLLDSTVVNVGAPAIRADLGGSLSSLQWIAASYTLALAVGLLTGGRLGDMYGRRRMLMVGLVGFVVASVACALAWSPAALIGARIGQGLFAAVMVPQAFGLIRDLFGPADVGKAFAALGPVIGLSTVAGPVVAGGLIELDPFGTGWRSIFLINVPLGIYALIAGRRALPIARPRPGRLDPLGALLAGAAMFALVYPLVQGRELGWPAWTLALPVAAVVVLVGFVLQQRRRAATGRDPLVHLSVLTRRSYAAGVVFVIVFFAAIVGLTLSLGLYLQVGAGFSPIRASLYLAASAVGAFLGSGVGSVVGPRVGRPVLHLGLTIMAVGCAVLAVTLAGLDAGERPGFATLAPGLLVFGVGMGMIFVPLFDIILGEIEDHEVGSAAGLLESLQQLGASLGVAALATVFFSRLGFDELGPRAALAAGRPADAAHTTVLITLVLIAVAFAIGFLLPRRARQDAPA